MVLVRVQAVTCLGFADRFPLGVARVDLGQLGTLAGLYPALAQRAAVPELVQQRYADAG